jgi:predicted nuclease of restriction endonuclease-like (RecB) superfamily
LAKKKTARKTERALSETEGAISAPSDYPQLLAALKLRIQTARVQAHLAANRELVQLYWDLGRIIVEQQEIEGWGKSVIERISFDLVAEFPDMKGLSLSNLWRMRSFYLAHSQLSAILAQPVRELEGTAPGGGNLAQPVRELGKASALPAGNLQQAVGEILKQAVAGLERSQCPEPLLSIPWGHNITLIEKLKDPALRLWYAAQTSEHGWSRAVLVHQIESELHLRATSQSNNFALTLPDPQSDLARELIKDSFNLEFLDVRESIRERELEESLITNLRDFLLELGTGFAFIGNQYRLEIGGQDYFLDLLFYHTRLHCHVVVELKIEAFKPEHAGKMQFYLAAVDDLLKSDRDAPTIGILLCKEKNKVVVEYALRDASKPIAVADYTLQKTLPKELRDELPSAAELKKQLKGGEKP